MLGASETPYDLRFHFLGIPVRVHPMFWLVAAIFGWQPNNIPAVLIWMACVFVSILVHEYGHGAVARAFGCRPSIVLWAGGGLCYSEMDRQTPRQRLAVVLSGPGAGFVLCGIVMLLASVIFGLTPREHFSVVQDLLGLSADQDALDAAFGKLGPRTNRMVYGFLVEINIFWGLINLLPIWPLDGGRVSEILLSHINPYEGARWGHILSLIVAGLIAVLAYSVPEKPDLFLALFFGYFAVVNFQILQMIHQAQMMGIYNDEDWWKR